MKRLALASNTVVNWVSYAPDGEGRCDGRKTKQFEAEIRLWEIDKIL